MPSAMRPTAFASLHCFRMMVYAATLAPYGKGCEVLKKIIAADVIAVQLWRVSDCYGGKISEQGSRDLPRSTPPLLSHSDMLYVEADGSMILSRTSRFHPQENTECSQSCHS